VAAFLAAVLWRREVQARGVERRNDAASGRPVVTSSRAPRPTIRSPDQHEGIKDAAAGIHRSGVAGVDAGAAAQQLYVAEIKPYASVPKKVRP